MGIHFMHNPDWLATKDLNLVFDDVSPYAVITENGYAGTAGITGTSEVFEYTTVRMLRKALGIQEPVAFALGCRFRINTPPSEKYVVLGVTDESLAVHCCLALREDNTLAVYRGTSLNDDPLRWGITPQLEVMRWYRLGFRGILHPYLGRAEIHLDGETIVQVDEIPTLADDARPSQGGIAIGTAEAFVTGHYYMIDAATPGPTDLIPDLLILTQRPTANGLYTFSPVGAPTSWEATADTPGHDADATYAKGAPRVSFVMGPDVPLYHRVYGMRLDSVLRVGSGQYGTVRFLSVVGDRPFLQTTWRGVGNVYQASSDLIDVNPATGMPWQASEIPLLQSGLQTEIPEDQPPPPGEKIPVGTIMVGGTGESGSCRYISFDGTTLYPQPASNPVPGTGLAAFARLSTGDIVQVGGNAPNFPTTGAGVWKSSDLTKLSECTDTRVGGTCLAADAMGNWYSLEGPNPVNFISFNANSNLVKTWSIAPHPDYTTFISAMAVSLDGLTAFVWLATGGSKPETGRRRIHRFDLFGAGYWSGIFYNDFNANAPGHQSLLVAPNGNLIVAFSDLNDANMGAIRCYNPTNATLIWTAGTPAGADPAQLDWQGLALGIPGDTHFLAWGWDWTVTTSSQCRYCWFSYATGAPDNARNFTPEDGDFKFDSQIVVLSTAVPLPAGATRAVRSASGRRSLRRAR